MTTSCPHRYASSAPCAGCRKQERDRRDAHDPDWYQRTAHCGSCGQPGDYCLCTPRDPCGCAHLHPIGSGLNRDAADVYAQAVADQDELF